jgi:hypothetical protein
MKHRCIIGGGMKKRKYGDDVIAKPHDEEEIEHIEKKMAKRKKIKDSDTVENDRHKENDLARKMQSGPGTATAARNY